MALKKHKKLLTGIVIAFLFVGFVAVSTYKLYNLAEEITQTEAEEFIGTAIPTGANNKHFVVQEGMDSAVFLRFDVSEEDAASFIENLGISEPLTEEHTKAFSRPVGRVVWWDPGEFTNTASVKSKYEPGKLTFDVAVHQISEDKRTVYLAAF